MGEKEKIAWNVDLEVSLFHAMRRHKPVGLNRHFQMIAIHEKLNGAVREKISSRQIWRHLETMYDLAALNESEIVPLPVTKQTDFDLIGEGFDALKEEEFPRVMSEKPTGDKVSRDASREPKEREQKEREHKDREHKEREHREPREHREHKDREHKDREHREHRDREHREREHKDGRESDKHRESERHRDTDRPGKHDKSGKASRDSERLSESTRSDSPLRDKRKRTRQTIHSPASTETTPTSKRARRN